jgi:hypothetical protein
MTNPAHAIRWWIGRIWLTVMGLGVWLVPLLMIYLYPEETDYWKKILIINLSMTALLVIYGLIFGFPGF